jgi:hypothetical protein
MPRKPKATPTQPHTVEEKPTIAVKGKKRKERDDSDPDETRRRFEVEIIEKGRKEKLVGKTSEARTKAKRHLPTSSLSGTDPAVMNPPAKVSTPSTPTLKIRLPRLSSLISPASSAVIHPPKLIVDNAKRV